MSSTFDKNYLNFNIPCIKKCILFSARNYAAPAMEFICPACGLDALGRQGLTSRHIFVCRNAEAVEIRKKHRIGHPSALWSEQRLFAIPLIKLFVKKAQVRYVAIESIDREFRRTWGDDAKKRKEFQSEEAAERKALSKALPRGAREAVIATAARIKMEKEQAKSKAAAAKAQVAAAKAAARRA